MDSPCPLLQREEDPGRQAEIPKDKKDARLKSPESGKQKEQDVLSSLLDKPGNQERAQEVTEYRKRETWTKGEGIQWRARELGRRKSERARQDEVEIGTLCLEGADFSS